MRGCSECHPEGRKPWPRPPCPLQGLALSAWAQGTCRASARHQIRQELKTAKFSPERRDTRGASFAASPVALCHPSPVINTSKWAAVCPRHGLNNLLLQTWGRPTAWGSQASPLGFPSCTPGRSPGLRFSPWLFSPGFGGPDPSLTSSLM